MRFLIRVGSLLVASLGACAAPGGQTGTNRAHEARDVLVAELQRQSRITQFPFNVDTAKVEYTMRPSAVVPGLMYQWATFRSSQVSHSALVAVAGALGPRNRLIKGPGDWLGLVDTWRPKDGAEAMNACAEIVQLTLTRNPHNPPTVFVGGGFSRPDLLAADTTAILTRAARPRITQAGRGDEAWHVDLWMINPSLDRVATHYRCAIAGGGPGVPSGVVLTPIDSIMRVGLH
jgi:hypothetical protein